MARKKTVKLIFSILTIFLVTAGCTTLPISRPLPENLLAEKICAIDEGRPFDISPDGNIIAYEDSALKLLHLPTKEGLVISTKVAEHLKWSPLGFSLAASFFNEGKSSIVIFDQYGFNIAETVIEGRVTNLAWLSDEEVIAATTSIKSYKFGNNYQSLIHRWQPGHGTPVSKSLRDSTIQPKTMTALKTLLERGLMLAVYPSANQILYMHPVEPPMFTPYYKLILRDLSTDRELEIGTPGIGSSGGRFSADGEKIVYSDGNAHTLFYSHWKGEVLKSVNSYGMNLEISPFSDYWFADGTLYFGESRVANLVPEGVGKFTANGRELFISSRGDIYHVTALRNIPPIPSLPVNSEKLLKLRAMRLEGLISGKEYSDSMKKMSLP